MTELEARRILNEHRSECPIFVRGKYSYHVRRDGRVDVYKAVGKSGQRWVFAYTCDRDFYGLPSDVRFPCNQIDKQNAAHVPSLATEAGRIAEPTS